MLVNKDESVLLIIDIQERLTPAMGHRDRVLRNAGLLVDGARILGVPVMVSEQYPKGIGPTEPAILAKAAQARAEVFEKLHFSCASHPGFLEKLSAKGLRQVVIAGIETHVCVLQTAISLHQAGFEVYVAKDACSSRKDSDEQTASRRLIQVGINLVSTEMVLFEWMHKAGTPEFKQISTLIK